MDLQQQRFRFMCHIHQKFNWLHPADTQPSFIGCTDMSDRELEQLVASHYQ